MMENEEEESILFPSVPGEGVVRILNRELDGSIEIL